MTPDAELRMRVYQEGQRAFNAKTECPYSDWRRGTWLKGYTAAVYEEAKRFEPAPNVEQNNTEQLAQAAGIHITAPLEFALIGRRQLQKFRDLVLEDAALQIEAMKPVHHFDIGDYAERIRALKSGV